MFKGIDKIIKQSSFVVHKGMNILFVSTYSKDYALVREEHIDKATKVLLSLGFKQD